jgi:predicted component of type VI protein secretion system
MGFQLIVIQGRSAAQALKLGAGVTTVGRQDGCQLQIKSSQVSRKHCELFEKKGLLLVKDLGSSNGTFVNGKRVKDQLVLEPGAELMIGGVKFRIERAADGAAAAPAAPAKAVDSGLAEPVEIAVDDVIEIEIDDAAAIEAGLGTDAEPTMMPAGAGAGASPAPVAAEKAADPAEMSEDAVADFLFNIELDEEDKL